MKHSHGTLATCQEHRCNMCVMICNINEKRLHLPGAEVPRFGPQVRGRAAARLDVARPAPSHGERRRTTTVAARGHGHWRTTPSRGEQPHRRAPAPQLRSWPPGVAVRAADVLLAAGSDCVRELPHRACPWLALEQLREGAVIGGMASAPRRSSSAGRWVRRATPWEERELWLRKKRCGREWMDRSVVVVEENNSSGRWISLGGSRPTHQTSGSKH
jgi:hypothetical protein